MADSSCFVIGPDGQRKIKLIDNGDGTFSVDVNAVIQLGDNGIGAVEHKDATTDNRSRVLNADEASASTEYADLVRVVGFSDKVGALTETAPASDTASSGLNGRLQRIAQRITSLIALLPAALGAGGGLKVDGSGTALKVDPVTATQTIYNVTLTNANTEYSQALPANCRGFEFNERSGIACRWSNVTGKVAAPTAPYATLRANDAHSSFPLNQAASPDTLYFASATAGAIIELTAYV